MSKAIENAKHSDGPWDVELDSDGMPVRVAQAAGDDAIICDIVACDLIRDGDDISEVENGPVTSANAKLIAAAPDLLRLLVKAYDSGHRKGWEEGPSTDEVMTEIHDCLCNLGIDLAKAQGKQP